MGKCALMASVGEKHMATDRNVAIANFDLTLQCMRADGRTVILADGCREK